MDIGKDLEARSSASPMYIVVNNKEDLTQTWKVKTDREVVYTHTHHRHTDKEQ